LDKQNKSVLSNIPYSGRIMEAIVKALDIQDESLGNKTARRHYEGKPISDYSRTRLLKAFGNALAESGIVPIPPIFNKNKVSMPKTLAEVANLFFVKWDHLCATIQGRSGKAVHIEEVFAQFLRLVVVDLALRVFALLRLANIPVPKSDIPLWAQENGTGKMLRELQQKMKITRDQLAARVGVSYTSVDNWLDGKICPTPQNIRILAEELSKAYKNELLLMELRRQYMFSQLSDVLSEYLGRDVVIELASALYRFIRLITDDVKHMDRPPVDEVSGMEYDTFRKGVDHNSNNTLLRNLAHIESDSDWQRDILAASSDWSIRFQEIVCLDSGLRIAAGLAQDILDLEDGYKDEAIEEIQRLLASTQLQGKDYLAVQRGDLNRAIDILEDGIAIRRGLVERHPSSPSAHMQLGSFLGMVGKNWQDPKLIKEGIYECKVSSGLREDWDGPLAEVGIILGNVCRYDEALIEFEAAIAKLGKMTPHLAYGYGYTLMMLKRFEDAISAFEVVFDSNPDYALALDDAAHCAFMTGDKTKGISYAKKGHKLGVSTTYIKWKSKVYDKLNK
jgi:tetratricopeptide (TPR) repeat protein